MDTSKIQNFLCFSPLSFFPLKGRFYHLKEPRKSATFFKQIKIKQKFADNVNQSHTTL